MGCCMDILKLTDTDFDQEVLKNNTPVLVDFWADWCTPCHMLEPTIEEIAGDYVGKVKVAKMNVDENAQTPPTYNIMSIPTVVLFKDGKPVQTFVGVQPKDSFAKAIDEALA